MSKGEARRKVGLRECSLIDVYRMLPRTNCKECGEPNCMAFATKVVNREFSVDDCPPLLKKENEKAYEQLKEMLAPAVKEVVVGTGDKAVKIGGKLVMYRHEFTYFNPTAIAIDVTDVMPKEEILNRVKGTEEFSYITYFGQELRLNMIAVRSTSDDPERFKTAVRKVAEKTKLSLTLCSLDSEVIETGLEAVPKTRPLLYAATKENWKDMAEIALSYNCPLTVFAPNDLKLLRSLTKSLLEYGVNDLVLDPGTLPNEGLRDTMNNFTTIRRVACKHGDRLFGFPLLGAPMTAWLADYQTTLDAKWNEACLAAMLITRFADILIMHSLEGWLLLPIVMLRHSIYTNPRKPPRTGLTALGKPDENSPIIVTTNFMYNAIAFDLALYGIDCHVINVGCNLPFGTALMMGLIGRDGSGFVDKVSETIEKSGIETKVKQRKLIIPVAAARFGKQLEERTGWSVVYRSTATSIVDFLKKCRR